MTVTLALLFMVVLINCEQPADRTGTDIENPNSPNNPDGSNNPDPEILPVRGQVHCKRCSSAFGSYSVFTAFRIPVFFAAAISIGVYAASSFRFDRILFGLPYL
ncbi:MAG: hypothetical protein LBD48_07585 [Treponema sp.]|jgi:hypothetical protein|nr:hypothetical protein [Treponema sp.]